MKIQMVDCDIRDNEIHIKNDANAGITFCQTSFNGGKPFCNHDGSCAEFQAKLEAKNTPTGKVE